MFKTNDLEGRYVVVQTIWNDLRYAGLLIKYFNSNHALALRNWVLLKKKNGKWVEEEKGEIAIISPKYYYAIHSKEKS